MSRREELVKEGRRAHWNIRDRDPDLAFEISHAVWYADTFNSWQAIEKMSACTHGLVHCPVCSDEQPWPSRANRGDLIP